MLHHVLMRRWTDEWYERSFLMQDTYDLESRFVCFCLTKNLPPPFLHSTSRIVSLSQAVPSYHSSTLDSTLGAFAQESQGATRWTSRNLVTKYTVVSEIWRRENHGKLCVFIVMEKPLPKRFFSAYEKWCRDAMLRKLLQNSRRPRRFAGPRSVVLELTGSSKSHRKPNNFSGQKWWATSSTHFCGSWISSMVSSPSGWIDETHWGNRFWEMGALLGPAITLGGILCVYVYW